MVRWRKRHCIHFCRLHNFPSKISTENVSCKNISSSQLGRGVGWSALPTTNWKIKLEHTQPLSKSKMHLNVTLFDNCSARDRTCLSLQCIPVKNKHVYVSTVEILACGKELQTVKTHWVYTETTKDQTEKTWVNLQRRRKPQWRPAENISLMNQGDFKCPACVSVVMCGYAYVHICVCVRVCVAVPVSSP